ncbi:MAG TPA: Hsp20/alpha crystallin family protein [Spirochaetota bacterium]|nr:Hsp20/alpha crystallin family protein [Spirochaetota bacterium]HPI88223.1 Hsp20/alpha crystallin family protein [Spirochaetota bacterium]HPR47233.1 Hsp20/alpha crystallin family protein [Spirochaetota bacterium]
MNFRIAKRDKTQRNDLDLFRRQISSIFDDFFDLKSTGFSDFQWSPAVDVEETKNAINVKADIPGINEKDLSVTLENDILTISGERREEKKEESKDNHYVVTERKYGSFSRSIRLPEGIHSDKIIANFKNGVLNVTIPRTKVESPKKISIEVKK